MLALLLAACAHRGPMRADSGETGETGEPAAIAPCGPWAGVVGVGTRWTYAPTEAYVAAWGFDGTYTIEVTTIEKDIVTLAQAGEYTGESGSFAWARTDTWRCDADGAWWIRTEASTSGTSDGHPIATEGWRTFAPGWLVRPAVLQSWADTFTVTASTNGGEPIEGEASCVTTFGAEEARTLEGRAFTARQVTPACEGVGADPMWLGEGLGVVETEEERLIAYAP